MTAGTPGRISMLVTQVSFLNGFGNTTIMFSTQPFAGTSNGGASITTSGFERQPSTHCTGGGASFASPSIAPPSAHLAMVSISLCRSEKFSMKCPYRGSRHFIENFSLLQSEIDTIAKWADGGAIEGDAK